MFETSSTERDTFSILMEQNQAKYFWSQQYRNLEITNLAEGEADTTPAPEDIVSSRTFLHAGVPMLEVPAGHTATCITRL